MQVAAVDVGSNAIRMSIVEKKNGTIRVLKRLRYPVRLGSDVFSTGRIQESTERKACAAFLAMSNILSKYNLSDRRIVATSALRDAENKIEFVRTIKKKTGLSIEVISGEEEADLIFEAIQERVAVGTSRYATLDIGGGSVEISLIDGKVRRPWSLELGTLRLLNYSGNESELYHLIFSNLRRRGISKCEKPIDFLIGTGGNLECFGRLRCQILGKKSRFRLTFKELNKIYYELLQHTETSRVKKLNLRKDRADVIIPACLLTMVVLLELDIEDLVIPFVGLRDGVLLKMLQSY